MEIAIGLAHLVLLAKFGLIGGGLEGWVENRRSPTCLILTTVVEWLCRIENKNMDAPIRELRPVTEQEAYKIVEYSCFYDLMDFLTDKPLASFDIKYIFIGMLALRGVYCAEWEEGLILKRLREAEEQGLIYLKDGYYTTRPSLLDD